MKDPNKNPTQGRQTDSDAAEAESAVGLGVSKGAPPSNTAPPNCKTPEFHILRSGIDSLYLSYKGDLYEQAESALTTLKECAQIGDKSLAQMPLIDHMFEVSGRGQRSFPFSIKDNWYTIALSKRSSESFPLAYVQISSKLLTYAQDNILGIINDDLKPVINTLGQTYQPPTVSRVDLCVDFVTDTPLENITIDQWVRRSKKINQYYEGDIFTGWSIGQAGVISARLYNKTVEIRKSKKDYMEEIWLSHGWQPDQTVWRLEFQLRREPVKELGINHLGSLLLQQASAWKYLTTEWLRLTNPIETDNTKSRWPTHPLWEHLSNYAWDITGSYDIKRVKKERIPDDMYLFKNGLSGITTYMAVRGEEKLEQGLDNFIREAQQYFIDESRLTGVTMTDYINEKVREKTRKYNTLKNKPRSEVAEKKRLAREKDKYSKGKDGE